MLRKTAYEAFNRSGEFESNMTSSETINSLSVTCIDVKGVDVTGAIIENVNISERTRVRWRVKGGESSASPYTVSVKVVTSEDQQFEIEEIVTIF